MSVRLRLRRTGTRNKPCYRIVAADQRSPRDGRFIEILGYYDPRHQDEKVNLERVDYWIKNGAQPTETVSSIIKRAQEGKSFQPEPKVIEIMPAPPPPKPPKAEETAAPEAKAEESVAEETPAAADATEAAGSEEKSE